MKLRVENRSAIAVPITARGEDWVVEVSPTSFTTIDKPGDVWTVGAKPSILEGIAHGVETILKALRAFITQRDLLDDKGVALELVIENQGTSAVRIVPGEVVNESELAPGQSTTVNAVDYVELRELGNAPQQGGTPD